MLKSKIRKSVNLPIGFVVFDDGHVGDNRVKNDDGSLKLLAIDQFPSMPFMQNEDGWVMNDIAAYERAQNDSLARSILQRVPVLADSSKVDGLSVNERLKEIIPASASSPAEFIQVSKYIAKVRYDRELSRQRIIQEVIDRNKPAVEKNPTIDDIQPDKD